MCCCCARPNKKQRSLPPPPMSSYRLDEETAMNTKSPPRREPLPPKPLYLWSSAYTDHEKKEFRFQGFEPCYIACIKDLEHQIKLKCERIDIVSSENNTDLTLELEPLLVRYSGLVEALQSMECKDRVFEDDIWKTDDVLSKFSGEKRRITRLAQDSDPLNDHLQKNIVLAVLGYIYKWDFANDMKRRYGNVTSTVDRVLLGLGGGAFLLVPMIIMTKVTDVNARLIIVSVATLLFALAISLTTTSRDSLVAATAAYAAVMVVYIGSSSAGGGN